jgi:hypothetical protein
MQPPMARGEKMIFLSLGFLKFFVRSFVICRKRLGFKKNLQIWII